MEDLFLASNVTETVRKNNSDFEKYLAISLNNIYSLSSLEYAVKISKSVKENKTKRNKKHLNVEYNCYFKMAVISMEGVNLPHSFSKSKKGKEQLSLRQ